MPKAFTYRWLPSALLLLGLATHFTGLLTSPPGLWGDAARLGIHTADFLRDNLWPFYVFHLYAPNPLVNYLQAPVLAVFGFNRAAIRGLTAFAGALAVPGVYLVAREVFASQGTRFARRAGVLAALGMALLPYVTLYSHDGTEHFLVPVLALLAVASLWRGLRRGRLADFILAGFVLGLSQYSYIVARFLPVALAAGMLVAFLPERALFRQWRGLLLTAGVGAAVALPQWVQFLVAPYTFVARTQQAAGQLIFGLPDAPSVFLAKLVNQLLMFGVRWENAYGPYSSRPLLDPVLFAGLLVALVWGVVRTSRGHRFALVVAGVMLVPDLVAFEGLSPSVHRLIPAIPFVFLLAGVGLSHVWAWLASRPELPVRSGFVIVAALLVASAERHVNFVRQVAPRVQAADGLEWRNSLVEIVEANYIAGHRDDAILIPTSEYQRAPLAFLLRQNYSRRESGFPPPLELGDVVTVVAPEDPHRPTTEGLPAGHAPDEWVLLQDGGAYFLPPVEGSVQQTGEGEQLFASNGALVARAFEARWIGVQPDVTPLDFAFENGLALAGYSSSAFTPGQSLTITLNWRPERRVRRDAQVFVQVLDWQDTAVAGIHDWPLRGTYRVSAWTPGQTMPLTYRLPLPPELGPGPYRLIAGVVDLTTQARIPLTQGGEFATVDTFRVPLPGPSDQPDERVEAAFGEAIRLVGYTLLPADDGLAVDLFWEAHSPPREDYTIFVHLVDEAGNIVAQSDAQALDGAYPTSIWMPGETVVEARSISAPPGEYTVFVGLYHPQTLERLSASAGGESLADDLLPLGTIQVR